MNLKLRNMVISMATLRGAPRKRSTPEVKDKRRMIPLRRKLVIQRALLAAEPIPIPKGNKRRKSLPKVVNSKNSEKPNSFDGEIKKGEEAEAWLLGLKKYFRVPDFLENMKARVATFNLNGKASIWWEDLKNVKGVCEEDLSWEWFEKYFRKKYLSEKYFDEKTKEFYELKLGQLTIEEYVKKFLDLLRYVPYIKAEKAKVQRFISILPKDYQNRIEFDEPKTLEGPI
jgi:hypothetical protein